MMKPEYLGIYTQKIADKYNVAPIIVYDRIQTEESKLVDKYFNPQLKLFKSSYYLNAAGIVSKSYKDLELLVRGE